jgi:hypothetical protein
MPVHRLLKDVVEQRIMRRFLVVTLMEKGFPVKSVQ